MHKIISKRGRKPPTPPTPEGDDHSLWMLGFGQEEDTVAPEEDDRFYPDHWIIEHRNELHYHLPTCPLRVGAMIELPEGSADIWVGTKWINIDMCDLCELLHRETIDVTIGYRTYQMVTR